MRWRLRLIIGFVPAPHEGKDAHAAERHQREPRQAFLPARQNEKCRQQRTERAAEIAADLKQRLRETVRAAGRKTGEP